MASKANESKAYAELADITVSSKAFRKADGAPYADDDKRLSVAEIEDHARARDAAKSIIFDTFIDQPHANPSEQRWEMQRKAVLAKLTGTALGSFGNYFTRLPSESTPIDIDPVYESGEPNVVHTNQQIGRLRATQDDPIDFMEQALGYVRQREITRKDAVGPENYATTLKYFADKYADLDEDSEIDEPEIRKLVRQNLDGFFKIAQKDTPNPVEMTNIYASIRTLPAGTVDARHIKPLLEQTAALLPDFTPQVSRVLIKAIPKLNLAEHGEEAAEILNLVLRKNKQFEITQDLRDIVRAISVLPKSVAADHSIAAMFEYRNELEQSLDLESADEMMHRLRIIADDVVGTNELYRYLKQLAANVGKTAVLRVKDGQREGIYSSAQQAEVKKTLQRIKENFDAI